MPYIKARLIDRFKLIDEAGGIEEGVIWAIPGSDKYPDGIRYQLAYIPRGSIEPAVLYDNHYPKGHHKHIRGQEIPYQFSSLRSLSDDFKRDMERQK